MKCWKELLNYSDKSIFSSGDSTILPHIRGVQRFHCAEQFCPPTNPVTGSRDFVENDLVIQPILVSNPLRDSFFFFRLLSKAGPPSQHWLSLFSTLSVHAGI